MLSAQIAKPRTLLRGIATLKAAGATAEAPSTAPRGSRRRCRSTGAPTPAATSAHADPRMALDTRKRAEYKKGTVVPPRPAGCAGQDPGANHVRAQSIYRMAPAVSLSRPAKHLLRRSRWLAAPPLALV